MIRLRGKYDGKVAFVFFGGPSVMLRFDTLPRIDKSRVVTFAEVAAVTPKFLASGVELDYVLMPFPDKAASNTFQNAVYRGVLAGVDVEPFLRLEFRPEARYIVEHADSLFQKWRPQRTSKRLRWADNVFMDNSPLDLLLKHRHLKLIVRQGEFPNWYPAIRLENECYTFRNSDRVLKVQHSNSSAWRSGDGLDLETYFNPVVEGDQVELPPSPFLDTATSAIFPLMKFLGFQRVFLFGYDMNMLGAFEYSAPFTFKSILHFSWYIYAARRALNYHYVPNWPPYLRPKRAFQDMEWVLRYKGLDIRRVIHDRRYVGKVRGMRDIGFDDISDYFL